jgi:hypothetical protein
MKLFYLDIWFGTISCDLRSIQFDVIRVMFNTSLGFSWMELSVFEMLLQKMVPRWFVSTLMATSIYGLPITNIWKKNENTMPNNFIMTAMFKCKPSIV